MKIQELLPLLEKEINTHMTNFTNKSQQSKKLTEQLDKIHAEMKEIASELKYVLPIVKEQNPSIVTLLEELI